MPDEDLTREAGILEREDPVPDQYIVRLSQDVGRVGATADLAPDASVARVAEVLADAFHGEILSVYRHAFDGFSVRMSRSDALAMNRDPAIGYVEEDAYVRIDVTQTNPPVGLDRIDQRDLPLDSSYTYTASGAGVTAYVIDSGIRLDHTEFTGRVASGVDLIDGGTADDCNGHGTHVAGTVGGTTYGVAKQVSLVAVRVAGCNGTGTTAQLIAGVDWVTGDHQAAVPAVANMSIGTSTSTSIDSAVAASVADGITYSVSAGNDGINACNQSPASAPDAITVGATDATDARPSFSNFGSCVDLFAPGVGIRSAWNGSDTDSRSLGGTSMSTPHVSGAAALHLEGQPTASPAAVTQAIESNATFGYVSDARGSPNLILFVGSQPKTSFHVNTTADTDAVCDPSPGDCSFREAITAANLRPGLDRIFFDIQGTAPHPIQPGSPLPAITGPVIIDATLHPDYVDHPVIELNGTSAGATGTGLTLASGGGGSTIRGLAINRFGFDGISVSVDAPDNRIEGNYLGTNPAGFVAMGNGRFGLVVSSAGNIIGGTSPAHANVLSGNLAVGVRVSGSSNTLQGNLVGVNADASGPLGNVGDGIVITGANHTIGGTADGAGNVASGNGQAGILLGGGTSGNVVQGNDIGTGPNGQGDIGNGLAGVAVQSASDNIIGGTATGAANVIAHNGRQGVHVSDGSGNMVSRNSIHDNGDPSGTNYLGIDLGQSGVAPNDPANPPDPPDADTGANQLQNYPLITSASTAGASTQVNGSLESTPSTTFRLEFFANPSCDPSGFGEGRTYLESIDVTTDGAGVATFSPLSRVSVQAGRALTATATRVATGDTSEFSMCQTVAAGTSVETIVNSPNDLDDGVCNATHCSLREAITVSNAQPGIDTISFNLASPPYVISPSSALPAITAPVRIDGTTQPGFTGSPLVQLDGAGAGLSADGVTVLAGGGGSTIQGLSITRFRNGVVLDLGAPGNTVIGNYVGLAASGSAAGNRGYGVYVSSANNIIGGPTSAARNVISGNGSAGMRIGGFFEPTQATSNTVQGNYVGTDPAASTSLPNSDGVVVLSSGNTIGGTVAGTGNVISGNRQSGVVLTGSTSTNNKVQGNAIGTDMTGSLALGNEAAGIAMGGGTQNIIGGQAPGAGNIIAHNHRMGVHITAGSGNRVSMNSISDNADPGGTDYLGLDLGPSGVTQNDPANPPDPPDIDTGANELQNHPVLTAVTPSGFVTLLDGYLESAPTTAYRLEFFSTPACDASGFGEGKSFIGALEDTTDGSGRLSFNSLSLPATLVGGHAVTATATDPSGNTSEFSMCRAVPGQADYEVNTTNDVDNDACNAQHCSLREAIEIANAHPGADRIVFDIPGPAPVEITARFLPSITDPVTIDGATQPGYAGSPIVQLNGTDGISDGLRIANPQGSSVIRGLAIVRYFHGIRIQPIASDSVVEGNYIGLDAAGMAVGNTINGILVEGSRTTIGGTTPQTGNVIASNGNDAVRLDGSNSNTVQGNIIGADPTATVAMPNQTGISILDSAANTIGGASAGSGNVIGGSISTGIVLNGSTSSGNTVQGNGIGVGMAGAPLANARGVHVGGGAHDNLIGGTSGGAGNIIAHNAGIGVAIHSDSTFNRILGNQIHDNAGSPGSNQLGIDLGLDQVTPNDHNDGDTGANHRQNFPVIEEALTSGSSTTVAGTLNSVPGQTFRLEFFSSAGCDPPGFGEGEVFEGTADVTTNGSGNASFAAVGLTDVVPVGHVITATATSSDGNTSEFSMCRTVGAPPPSGGVPSTITAGEAHTCLISPTDQVTCWGENSSGQLGDGTTTDRPRPTTVQGLLGSVASISAGFRHTCALLDSGTVWCWGANGQGQLGDGTTNDRLMPVQVQGISDAIGIAAANGEYTCALLGGGDAKCWGSNSWGQLGNGTTIPSSIPVGVVGIANAVSISAGGGHACIASDDGHAWCWGLNIKGELGDGTTVNRSTPVEVVGVSDAVTVAAGATQTCVVRFTGDIACWGWNAYGQLGNGTNVDSSTPTSAVGISDSIAVSSLGDHVCALQVTGQARCWGNNGNGRLGDGTTTDRSTPAPVATQEDLVEIAAGTLHTCALTSDGGVLCWGRNDSGQLGDGTTTGSLTPVEVVFGGTNPPATPSAPTAVAGNASATVSWTAPPDGGSPITGYRVVSNPGGHTEEVDGSTIQAVVSGLANGTSYTFTVVAINAFGESEASPPSNAVTPRTVPDPPTNVVASAGNARANVSWTASASHGGSAITGYVVTSSPGNVTASTTGATNVTVMGLTNGTTYTFTVVAVNAAGNSQPSLPSNAVTPQAGLPSAPRNPAASPGNGLATVTWTAPTSIGGSPITSYTVVSFPGGFTAQVGGSMLTAQVTGLTNGTAYRFRVFATNASGDGPMSPLSNAVIPRTVPDSPTNVSATAGQASATVSWTAPTWNGGSPITGYRVIASPGGATRNVGLVTTTTMTGLTNGTTYTFTVSAINAAGASPPSVPSNPVTPRSVPAAPTNVVATAGNGSATVTWSAPSNTGGSPITGYTVSSNVGGFSVTVDGSTLTAQVTGLTNGTIYRFRVRAINEAGNGPYSPYSNAVVPQGPPRAPVNVLAYPGNQSATVTWSPPVGSTGITGYRITTQPGGQAVEVAGSARSVLVSGLTNGVMYTFTVAATNVHGTGPESVASNAVTPSDTIRRIVFQSNRDGDWEIFSMNADGSGVVQLTFNTVADLDPAQSPDGTRIVFIRGTGTASEIYTMAADGSDQAPLLSTPDDADAGPNWSGDGSRIVFASQYQGDDYEIVTVNADGSGLAGLTSTPTNVDDVFPAWSPVDDRIAFHSNSDGDTEIYVIKADGTGLTQLTNDPTVIGAPRDSLASWSPDGTQLVFSSNRNVDGTNLDRDDELYTMNADGTGAFRLTTNGSANDVAGSWSRDGARIVFASQAQDGNYEIYSIDVDGTDPVNLTNRKGHDTLPNW